MKPTRTIEQIKEALALPDTSALSFSAEEVHTALAQQFYFGLDTALAAPAAPLPAQPETAGCSQSEPVTAPLPELTGPSELEAENERLRDALADKVSASTLLTEFNLKGGALNMQFAGGACQLFAESFGQQFREMGGDNYIEMGFVCKDGLRLLVTLQRCDGKTPANLKAEAETKLALVENELADLRSAASTSPAPAQQQEPSAIESKLRDAVTILRGALVSAECAIKGREHTGFIAKALVATEFASALAGSAETAAPGASTEDKQ